MQHANEVQIGQLRDLGLNAYEARAYLTLLGKDSFTATQIADYAAVPRQRIYDTLAALAERGLVISRPGRRGNTYAAVSPQQALSSLLEAEQQRLGQLAQATSRLIEELSAVFNEGQKEQSPLEYIEVLRGPAISQRFAEIQQNCQREILVFTKPPYARPPEENTEGLEVIDRKIQARSVYEYEVLENPETREAIRLFIQRGEQARFVDTLPMKLVIVDESIVMFAMEDPLAGRKELTILVIENPQLALALKLAFEAAWARGETFEQTLKRLNLPAS
jgi:HTH-type transcriptional regulator, sugar sensing transcriptional regulator